MTSAERILAGAGVNIAGTHGIGRGSGDIAETVVAHVVGIEERVVLGIVNGFQDILETSLFEGFVPDLNALLDGAAPFLGEGTVHIEDNLAGRLHQFSLKIALTVLRLGLDAPAVDEGALTYAVFVGGIDILVEDEIAYAVILQAHRHGLVGQSTQRTVDDNGIGLRHGTCRHIRQQ